MDHSTMANSSRVRTFEQDDTPLSERKRRRRREPPIENLAGKLLNRERFGGGRKAGVHWHWQRNFYSAVFPNMTVVNVEKPVCFLRKFSPDGKLLIAFSGLQTALEIYEYKGVESAGQLLRKHSGVVLCHEDEYGSLEIRKSLFSSLFKLKFMISVIEGPGQEQLNRECSLFTQDNRHLIVAAAAPAMMNDEQRGPQLSEIYQTQDSLPLTHNMPPEDIHIFSVDLKEGRLCDKRVFKCDKIFLSHNQGLYLLDRTLAVMSVQHQLIHLFQVEETTGQLIPLQSIGRYLYDDDELTLRNGPPVPGRPSIEAAYGGLKHRLYAWLFRRAQSQSKAADNLTALRRYYQRFPVYEKLRMWRMQLLDKERILMRMAAEDVITYKVADPSAHPFLFLLYNYKTTKIEGVWDNVSTELLKLYETDTDAFRHPDGGVRFPCSLSSCRHALEHHERYKRTIQNAKGGGATEVIKRVLSQLPICAQSFSTSPYLDLSLFSYDEKLVSLLERPKACGDCPVRFYCRQTQQLRFQLYCGLASRGSAAPSHSQRNLVAFVFHPTDPFAVSVQRNNRDYVVNFHLRGVPDISAG